MKLPACSTTYLGSLPHLVRDLPSVLEPAPASDATADAEAIVCRTVVVRADAAQLQSDLERELRTLLGFDGRLGR